MELQIKIGDDFVDLFPKTKIKYIFNSPAFSNEIIAGDVSQIINLPMTAKNKRIFSFLHRPEVSAAMGQDYDCKVFLSGVKIIEGTFKLKRASSGGFRGNIVGGISEFKNQVGESNITDIDFGDDITLGASDAQARGYLKSAALSSYPTHPMVAFPVKNWEFMGEKGAAEDYQLSTPSSRGWGFVNNFLSDKFSDLSGNVEVFGSAGSNVYFTPFLYLKFILDKLFGEYDYDLGGDWYDDSEISTLVMNHLNCMNESGYNWFFAAPRQLSPSQLVPEITIKDLLQGLKKIFNLGFFFDYTRRTFYIEPLKKLLSSDVVDWTDKAEPIEEIVSMDRKSGYTMKVKWDGNDNITEDYIKSLNGYNILASVNSTANLPPDGNSVGDVRYVRYECMYYLWTNDGVGSPEWQAFSYPYQDYTDGDGMNEIESELSPIPSSVEFYTGWDQDTEEYVTVQYKVPLLDQVGNFKRISLSDNPFTGRILFYRGIKTDSRGYYYPLGQSDNVDLHGVDSGSYSLKWEGEEGLYNTWWRQWNEFMDNTKETKWILHLGIADILNLDLRKKVRIASNNYLIKKITLEFPFKGRAEAILMKITGDTTDNSLSWSSSSLRGDYTNESPNDDFNEDFWK